LIVLSFRPLQNGSAVLVRGAHFRISPDGTLRGPDNTIAARYVDGLWHLGQRPHLSFECTGPIYLRVTHRYGRRESIGPYASIRAANGAIYTNDSCIGVHFTRVQPATDAVDTWREVSLLSSAEEAH
jgi:hypothetical protein